MLTPEQALAEVARLRRIADAAERWAVARRTMDVTRAQFLAIERDLVAAVEGRA